MTHTLGASEVAAVLGLSPWTGPHEVWMRVHGLRPRYEQATTGPLWLGKILEDGIRRAHASELGRRINRGPSLDQPGWTVAVFGGGGEVVGHARPDGWWRSRPGVYHLIEIKTTADWDGWGTDGSDQVPVYYAAQVLWQMVAARQRWGRRLAAPDISTTLVALNVRSREHRVYHVQYAHEVAARLVGEVAAWWAAHVRDAEPPPPAGTSECVELLRKLYPSPSPKAPRRWYDGDAREVAALLERYTTAKKAEKAAAEAATLAKAEILTLLGPHDGVREVLTVTRGSSPRIMPWSSDV